MKLKQDNINFKPITLVLETAEEARAFAEIMDDIDARTPEAQKLAMTLSNAITSCAVEIPAERKTECTLMLNS